MRSSPESSRMIRAVCAAMIAGACTFLNVYCTQPLLPLFERIFHASEVQVSLTVGAVTFAVALMAPWVGMVAETFGRKKVIVPSLFAMGIATLATASARNLHELIFLRLVQGMFVPGVIAVIMAYINEEFHSRVGRVMSAYIAGTVFGGFFGRFLTGLIAANGNWRLAFVVLGILDLLGALAVQQWLPLATHFKPAEHIFTSFTDLWRHLRNPRLMAVCGMGFTILFCLVGAFSYISFYLARPPFKLQPAALGSIFLVYLLGCIATPIAGRFLDQRVFRLTSILAMALSLIGLSLTLCSKLPVVIAGLSFFCTGIFISQSAATVLTGKVAKQARSAAAGLYVTFYYAGGSVGSVVTGWFWLKGGWPACTGLFLVVISVTLGLSFLGSKAV